MIKSLKIRLYFTRMSFGFEALTLQRLPLPYAIISGMLYVMDKCSYGRPVKGNAWCKLIISLTFPLLFGSFPFLCHLIW